MLTLSSTLADNSFCILLLSNNLSLHHVFTFKLVSLTVATQKQLKQIQGKHQRVGVWLSDACHNIYNTPGWLFITTNIMEGKERRKREKEEEKKEREEEEGGIGGREKT